MANNWKKTSKKVGISAGIVILTGFISVYQNNPKYLALIPLLVGILDVLKHR